MTIILGYLWSICNEKIVLAGRVVMCGLVANLIALLSNYNRGLLRLDNRVFYVTVQRNLNLATDPHRLTRTKTFWVCVCSCGSVADNTLNSYLYT